MQNYFLHETFLPAGLFFFLVYRTYMYIMISITKFLNFLVILELSKPYSVFKIIMSNLLITSLHQVKNLQWKFILQKYNFGSILVIIIKIN